MPDPNEEQFENCLKAFRPVAPEPLPLHITTHSAHAVPSRHRAALAVAAVACLAAAALAVIVFPRGSQSTNDEAPRHISSNTIPDGVSMPALTRLALDDKIAFDKIMTAKVQTQFPSMNSEQSALRVLAKE